MAGVLGVPTVSGLRTVVMAASEGLFDTMAPSTWHRCEGKNVGAVARRAR